MNAGSDPVRDVLTAVTGHDPDSVGDQDRLADLGMGSLDRVLLAVLVEERSGHALSDAALANIRTVADLKQHLQPTVSPR